MLRAQAESIAGIPHPPLTPGDILFGAAVGEVIAAPPGSPLAVGEHVLHYLGWREYASAPIASCTAIDRNADLVSTLGHGATAYAALTRGIRIAPGDTVLVTAGGSAIGSVAGPLARLLGVSRVIATTSSRTKARRLIHELGYDAALIRDSDEGFAQQLQRAAPDGVDVLVDNVGGEQLTVALDAARPHARFVLLGALSEQLSERPSPQHALTPNLSILPARGVLLRGYSADDDPDAAGEWRTRSSQWVAEGRLQLPHTVASGLSAAAPLLSSTIAGDVLGVALIDLRDSGETAPS